MSVSRLTLPSEFYDITSAKMLLPPEPKYFWASMLDQQAGAAELAKNAGAPYGVIPDQKLPANGADVPAGDVFSPDLNAGSPMPAYPDLFVVEDFAALPGNTVRMNRLVFADTTYTQASRRIQRATITTTGVDITGEQVEITIERYGGPLSAASGVVAPHVIEEFDVRRNPVHDLAARVGAHLRRDRFKFVDTVVATMACTSAATTRYVYPGDFTNALTADNSAFLSQGDRPWDLESCYRAEQVAESNNIPTFANGRYLGVMSPIQARQLRSNAAFRGAVQYYRDKNPVFQHYVGTLGAVDWFVSNTNPTATANSTITVQLGVVMGPGALAFAKAMAPEVRPDPATNFGQRVSVVWMADEGYQVLDNRFLVSCRSD